MVSLTRERSSAIAPALSFMLSPRSNYRGQFVQPRQRAIGGFRRHTIKHALDSLTLILIERGLLRFDIFPHESMGGDADGSGVASARFGAPAQIAEQRLEDLQRHPLRQPSVAILDHAVQRPRRHRPQQDRRMRLLDRTRRASDRIEVHELAVILRFLMSPDLLHRFDSFAEYLPAILPRHPMMLHLLDPSAGSDAEYEAPARE